MSVSADPPPEAGLGRPYTAPAPPLSASSPHRREAARERPASGRGTLAEGHLPLHHPLLFAPSRLEELEDRQHLGPAELISEGWHSTLRKPRALENQLDQEVVAVMPRVTG